MNLCFNYTGMFSLLVSLLDSGFEFCCSCCLFCEVMVLGFQLCFCYSLKFSQCSLYLVPCVFFILPGCSFMKFCLLLEFCSIGYHLVFVHWISYVLSFVLFLVLAFVYLLPSVFSPYSQFFLFGCLFGALGALAIDHLQIYTFSVSSFTSYIILELLQCVGIRTMRGPDSRQQKSLFLLSLRIVFQD